MTIATGGIESNITINDVNYVVHTFTSSGTLVVILGGDIEYLVVAGGGAGGSTPAADHRGGGGGAGGFLTGSTTISAGNITVTVGAGGSAQVGTIGANGSASVFGIVTSTGGGGGGMTSDGSAGGSGGGGGAAATALNFSGGAGTAGQGNNGGTGGTNSSTYRAGGAGGGAGGVGGNAGTTTGGGIGLQSSINGTATYYAGGGGQGGGLAGSGVGGLGGGGAGSGSDGFPGTANTGGGGGGCGPTNDSGGAGGSGIVIVRYVVDAGDSIFQPESIEFNAGGTGGVGGPYAGGGGGAGGYIPSTIDIEEDVLQNRDVLAITANGVNTGQNNTFVDSSTNNFTITRNGNTAQGSFSPYSPAGWSGHFDGTGDYLSAPSNAAFSPGTGDFTIECWAYLTATTGEGTLFYINATNGINLFLNISSNWGIARAGVAVDNNFGTPPSFNTWNHLAVSRSGSTIRAFINGTQVFSGSNASNYAQGAALIGSSNSFGTVTGYISNFRFVKGTAVYTAAFTPPTQPLTAVANTSLLTLQDNRFVDRSTNNFVITRNGDTRITPFSPFDPTSLYSTSVNGGSAYFDGTGDYLTVPSNAVFQFGTGDFTIECWIYKLNAGNGPIIDARGASTAVPWALYVDASNFPYFYDGTVYTSTVAILNSQWNHVVAVRTSSVLKIFVNGVEGYSASHTVALNPAATVYIGGQNFSSPSLMTGYISNLRIVKGTAVYPAAFTPPTTPVTAIANTSLLLNSTNANIVDVSGKNNIETLNGAQVSTSVTKYGSGSMSFDGVDDRLVIPNNPNLILAGGAWTIECWIYFTGNYSIFRSIFNKRTGQTATTSYQGYIKQTSGLLGFYNGTEYVSTAQVTTNLWHHCAWVYTGTNIQIYFNGVQVLNTAATITEVNEPVRLGSLDGNLEQYAGYIDDFRITKGVARYTATFTPPNEIYLEATQQSRGAGASGSALQAGEDNSLGGGAGGGSSETVAGGGGGVEVNGIILESNSEDFTNAATGGIKSTITVDSEEYIVHVFTSSEVFQTLTALNQVEYLVVAGGGGGGALYQSGGGGAGGYRTGNISLDPSTYAITVGAGGAGGSGVGAVGAKGFNSIFSSITSEGGGFGGNASSSDIGGNGGSGGGASAYSTVGGTGNAGPPIQGYNGGGGAGAPTYRAGGGGGAGGVGAAGSVSGNGGIGVFSSISGPSTGYAGGGAGGSYGSAPGSAISGYGGGDGGSTIAGASNRANATSGTANTGGGGGGTERDGTGQGGNGGSGIVIIRYPKFSSDTIIPLGGVVGQGGAGVYGGQPGVNGNGGLYGGGGGGTSNSSVDTAVGNGAGGAMRIIWPSTRQFPYPDDITATVTNLNNGTLQNNILAVETSEQQILMLNTAVSIKESPNWVDNLSNTYQIGTVVAYDPKIPVSSPRPVPLSPYVAVKELQILVTEVDHELMLINNDPKSVATWDDPSKYQKIDRVTPENDPRRITVRLLNYVVGVTGEGALVPTQIQTWF